MVWQTRGMSGLRGIIRGVEIVLRCLIIDFVEPFASLLLG